MWDYFVYPCFSCQSDMVLAPKELGNEYMEDKKYHNLMTRLKWRQVTFGYEGTSRFKQIFLSSLREL